MPIPPSVLIEPVDAFNELVVLDNAKIPLDVKFEKVEFPDTFNAPSISTLPPIFAFCPTPIPPEVTIAPVLLLTDWIGVDTVILLNTFTEFRNVVDPATSRTPPIPALPLVFTDAIFVTPVILTAPPIFVSPRFETPSTNNLLFTCISSNTFILPFNDRSSAIITE